MHCHLLVILTAKFRSWGDGVGKIQRICERAGMSTSMQKTFGFVNVEGGAFHDVTDTILTLPYSVAVSAAV